MRLGRKRGRQAVERALLVEVVGDHPGDQPVEVHLAPPAEHLLGLGRVAEQVVDLGRARLCRVERDVRPPVLDADPRERRGEESSIERAVPVASTKSSGRSCCIIIQMPRT
jgi:hypothetical protein